MAQKDMEKVLAKAVKENGLDGALIADMEGLALASALPASIDEDELAEAAAAVLIITDSRLSEAGKGKTVQASVETENGYFVITTAGDEYVISVLAPKDAKLGIILAAVRSIVKDI